MNLSTSLPLELVNQILYFSHLQKRQRNDTQNHASVLPRMFVSDSGLGGLPLFAVSSQSPLLSFFFLKQYLLGVFCPDY